MKNLFYRHKLKLFLVALVVMLGIGGVIYSAAPVASPTEEAPSAWSKRCNENDSSRCEMFWRANVEQTGQRVAEFAIGFPEDQKSARGVMILPLGILLTEDIQMQIDDGLAFKFKVKYCDAGGCVAYLNLSAQVLEALSKGSEASVAMKSGDGKDFVVKISLAGFKKTLDSLS